MYRVKTVAKVALVTSIRRHIQVRKVWEAWRIIHFQVDAKWFPSRQCKIWIQLEISLNCLLKVGSSALILVSQQVMTWLLWDTVRKKWQALTTITTSLACSTRVMPMIQTMAIERLPTCLARMLKVSSHLTTTIYNKHYPRLWEWIQSSRKKMKISVELWAIAHPITTNDSKIMGNNSYPSQLFLTVFVSFCIQTFK